VSLVFVLMGLSSGVLAAPAFPGAEGYGVTTTHGRYGTVVIVTNTNDSGPGSLREALLMTEPRIVIFRVSGTIHLDSAITITANNSNVAVFGQTAPGDGIAISGPDNQPILWIGTNDNASAFHDGLFQHLRFRHGMPVPEYAGQTDNIVIRAGTYNTVFDHNSFTWAGDENISFWYGGQHDITFSRNIFAEGAVFCRETAPGGFPGDLGQNAGPLIAGARENPVTNITFHHNLMMHSCLRNLRIDAGNDGSARGFQNINNVNYNNSGQNYRFNQGSSSSNTNPITVDVINNYFKDGPDSNPGKPFSLRREVDEPFPAMSLHLVGSTWRNQDGSPHPNNNEANNYEVGSMLIIQAGSGTPTFTKRVTPVSPQPAFAVTTTSAAQAYTSVVLNQDVGATKPALDSVDARLINDPEDGGAWSANNVPFPNGGGSYPILRTYNVPVDSDDDGVPDEYEVLVNTNPDEFEPQATLDHDGDGYTNIEEWVFSLSQLATPKPPTLVNTN
jgi:hypothetical protein